jgi:hypothetical protein
MYVYALKNRIGNRLLVTHDSDLVAISFVLTLSRQHVMRELDQNGVVARFMKRSCEAGLRQLCSTFGSDAEPARVQFGECYRLELGHNCNPFDFWVTLESRNHRASMADSIDMAKCVIQLASSEAACEPAFSCVRELLGECRHRTKFDFVNGLMTLMIQAIEEEPKIAVDTFCNAVREAAQAEEMERQKSVVRFAEYSIAMNETWIDEGGRQFFALAIELHPVQRGSKPWDYNTEAMSKVDCLLLVHHKVPVVWTWPTRDERPTRAQEAPAIVTVQQWSNGDCGRIPLRGHQSRCL